MPSKNGFGNSRTPIMKKVSYGSAMHYKNPVKKADKGLLAISKDLGDSKKPGDFSEIFNKQNEGLIAANKAKAEIVGDVIGGLNDVADTVKK